MRKNITLLLITAMLLSISACGSDNASNDSDTNSGEIGSSDTSAQDTSSEQLYVDDLGDYDFGGEEFTILTRVTPLFYPYLDATEETGDILNDAVYKRNRKLEDRFNFVFREDCFDWQGGAANDEPRQYLMAGDDTYELYESRCVHMFNYASEGMLYSIDELTMIDPSKPYWNQQLYSDLSICGKHFFAVGAFNISAYDFTHVLLFNKSLVDEYQLESPYELVRTGKWTFDKFGEMARQAVSDVNGDSVMDENDQYGYLANAAYPLPCFWIAADTVSIEKNANGELVYTAPEDEKFIDVYQKIFNITWDDNIWHRIGWDVDQAVELSMFCDGHALFANSSCYQISTIRDSETDFGIIPYPKYDESQEKYYTRIEGCELFGVPRTNQKLEMTGVILEAMACESQNTVIPAYYDVALKVKFTRDNESAEMLDLAFENRVFDYGDTLLCTELRDGVLRHEFAKDNRNAVSTLTSAQSKVDAKLKDLNDAFNALAG